MKGKNVSLERQALEQLRRGDLQGAQATLAHLAQLRPSDEKLARRLQQVEALIEKRRDAKARMQAEPLRYALAYIKVGRLEEGLRLLRAALAQDPGNSRLRDLALQVAHRLQPQAPQPNSISGPPSDAPSPMPLGQTMLLRTLQRVRARRRRPSQWLVEIPSRP